ncbi:unnamed protein product [Kluyveromyces dobzhanskii CBS 2104]|uniref:WGS project CCBQ000000000 data, contig 00105 n=1 Tax=Kluyveromyces dobzhanskii CBS 2104 TaxID=1427455 RepID=A0A0A8KZ73_9SACH|nr:unnamed protein product [Kluyveromyces dobzhanskii CBS 2104]
MSENVQVVVRVRPTNKKTCFQVQSQTIKTLEPPVKSFNFDHIFDESSSQTDLQAELCSKYVLNALEGYNACIFAYGQTGSGKTYTMRGGTANPGIIPLICEELFEALELDNTTVSTVTITYFEIYNEKLIDLLGDTSPRVREANDKKTFVQDITTFRVNRVEEVLEYLSVGDVKRSVATTRMNMESSRSHAIFTLSIKQKEPDGSIRESDLKLVDLAGSERANATLGIDNGRRMKEGSNINKSLSTLGRCISQLAKNSKLLIPYRDSLLTWVLKENLGGNSKTCMIACISPTDLEETLSTLRYATTAKDIKLSAIMNEIVPNVNEDMKAAIEAAAKSRKELELLRAEMSLLQSEHNTKSEQWKTHEKLLEGFKHVTKLNDFLENQLKHEISKSRDLQRENKISRLDKNNTQDALLRIVGALFVEHTRSPKSVTIDNLVSDLDDFIIQLDNDISSIV